MENSNHEFDDDIFTLHEDATAQRRAHILQYALISIFAILVLSVALYMSFWLTNNRLAYQSAIETTRQIEDSAVQDPEYDPNYWPADEFPDIPIIEAPTYDTRIDPNQPGRAEVNVPMSTASGFSAYADRLVAEGAKIYVRTQRMIIAAYKGVELHLMYGSGKNAAILCNEPEITFEEPEFEGFPLPDVGKLASVTTATGEGSRVLTYRLASPEDALLYAAKLKAEGWMMVGSIEPRDQAFTYSFKKDGPDDESTLQVSVDYFNGSDNYRIRFDIIQLPSSAWSA